MRRLARPVALAGALLVAMPWAPSARASPGVIVVPDVVYQTPSAGVDIKLDVYEPEGPGPFPGVVAVHGGGAREGGSRKGQIAGDSFRLAKEGFVAYAIDYRSNCDPRDPPPHTDPLLCGYPAPVPEMDVRTAIEWVRTNAATYHTDPSHVGVLGVSAGGMMANMASIHGTPGQDRADALVSWSGPSDLTLHPSGAGTTYIGCSYRVCSEKWAANSPTLVARRTSAPMYLSGGEFDHLVPLAEEQEEIDRYRHLGVATQWHMLYGVACHARSCVDRDPTIWTESVAWLHRYLDR